MTRAFAVGLAIGFFCISEATTSPVDVLRGHDVVADGTLGRPRLVSGMEAVGRRVPDPSIATDGTAQPTRHQEGLSEAQRGWRLIREGAYAPAEQAFGRAATLVPDDPAILVGQGLAHKLMGNDDQAIAGLEGAIHLDMRVRQAHVLLGDLYARRGDFERAIHHLETARKQDPSDIAAQHRLATVRLEYLAEVEFDRLFTAHFLVKYRSASIDSAHVHRIVDRLEQVYTEVGHSLSYFPEESFSVILYPGVEFWETMQNPEWVRGLFDGIIRLPADQTASYSGLPDSVLRHEYTHAVVNRMSAGRAPVWLSEGLAMYLEGTRERAVGRLGQQSMSSATTLPRRHDLLALSPQAAQEAYRDSYVATVSLIDRYGLGRVRALLVALSKDSDFPRVFQTVYETPFREFESGWAASSAGRRF